MHPEATQHKILDSISRLPEHFLRRKDALTRRKRPLRLDELPEDVLILIFSHCRIDDIFVLRLTCSTFRHIISAYSTHILPPVARRTFSRRELLLHLPTNSGEYTLSWMQGLIDHQLAAIVVDRHRFIHEHWTRYGIPAEDPYGDELRARVANGWHVLRRLSSIAMQVYRLDAKEILSRPKRKAAWTMAYKSRHEAEVVRLREELILERRMQYVDSISVDEAQNYIIMFVLLSTAWRVRDVRYVPNDYPEWPFDSSHGIDASRSIRRGESWVTWFILHQGLQLFWEQWWSLPVEAVETENHVRDRAFGAFFASSRPEDHKAHDPHEELHNMQHHFAEEVQSKLHLKSGGEVHYQHMRCFQAYNRHRDPLQNSGQAPPSVEETLSSVPFFINFSAHKVSDVDSNLTDQVALRYTMRQ